MDKIILGFIGGCVNQQPGIGREDLYYSVLIRKLKQSRHDADYRVALGSYHSYDRFPETIHQFIDRRHPDILFLFIRPFPLMPLFKPIVKYSDSDGNIRHALHPALVFRRNAWDERLSDHQNTGPYIFIPAKKFTLRDINLLAGFFLGLNRWALNHIATQIRNASVISRKYNVRFVILSPPRGIKSVMTDFVNRTTKDYLEQECQKEMIDYIDIFALDKNNFLNDNIHFNVSGHQCLGGILFDFLNDQF